MLQRLRKDRRGDGTCETIISQMQVGDDSEFAKISWDGACILVSVQEKKLEAFQPSQLLRNSSIERIPAKA